MTGRRSWRSATTVLGAAVLGAVASAGLVLVAPPAWAGWGTATNPPANVTPSPTYVGPCADWRTAAPTATCPASLGYIDALRAADGGVVPMTLPTSFATLTPSEQLFVVANLERVDRGVAPIKGVASALDTYAQGGADNDTDPSFPPYGAGGGSNWAGGTDILGSYSLWNYEDGPGGGNLDCTTPTDGGCWGHRDNILNTYAAPALMGGAVAASSRWGESVAQIFIGGDTTDSPYLTWSQVTSHLPVGIWPTSLSESVSSGGSGTRSVELWASGEAMNLQLSITGGQGTFSLGARSCNLAAGTSCNVAVSFFPRSIGSFDASLDVTGPNGTQVVPLHGSAGPGYRLVSSDGGIFTFGTAHFFGSTGGAPLNQPIVGMASTPDGGGYWLVASDGGIFSFGDAGFLGSMGGVRLNKPIVGMAPTPDGRGYWLVASDGGIFAFGDAGFHGSTGALHLNQPIVGMTATQDGAGYWLVASDGGIFAFGDAQFHGSMGGSRLNRPIVAMGTDRATGGYWLVAADGGVFSFGAPFLGGTGGQVLNVPIVGMASTPDGSGYWFVAGDGGVFNFGDAGFFGSMGGAPLNSPIVGMASP